ncbi:MAG: ribonuclease P protein component, partial [Lysobacter spongiicola]|nr:ribonuclease P protein component [Lysobacter spongiicola]
MTTHRFPRTARVRARPDFDRIFKQGRRVALPVLALHWTPPSAVDDSGEPTAPMPVPDSAGGARLGLAVSRKVDRRAVGRNRVKRVLREAFRQRRGFLRDGDYVVVARPGASA